MMCPLVVTLRCEGEGWQRCQRLRQKHFPPERNLVPAHIALFHHLPGEDLLQVETDAFAVWSLLGRFSVEVTRPRSLGRGVALNLHSPELLALHSALSRKWERWLTPQDQAKFSPHVTIQNKVDPAAARALLHSLILSFEPFSFSATGVEIWHYRNGPWELAKTIASR